MRTSARRLILKCGAISPCRSFAVYLRACHCLRHTIHPILSAGRTLGLRFMKLRHVHRERESNISVSRSDMILKKATGMRAVSVVCAPVVLVKQDRHRAGTVAADDLRTASKWA